MPTLYRNFLDGLTTDNPLASGATTVNSAGFASLPTVAAPDTMWLVLDPNGANGAPEVVQITAHTAAATSVTVTRAQQSTSARSHPSNTTWVIASTQADLDELPFRKMTTTGDILYASAANTAARLGVGSAGQVLAVAGGVPAWQSSGVPAGGSTGDVLVKTSATDYATGWTPLTGTKNRLINGGFDIWQRGTSFTVGAAAPHTADRWQVGRAAAATGMTVSRQLTGSTSIDNYYGLRAQRDSGNTSTQPLFVSQTMETPNCLSLAGKTMTLSYYARRGANYSPTSNNLTSDVFTGTGTDQNGFTSNFTGQVVASSLVVSLTTDWQRFTQTFTVNTTATQIRVGFSSSPTGTAGNNDWFEVTGVQLEVGSVATTFEQRLVQQELALCQRYFFRATGRVSGIWTSASTCRFVLNFPVTMRAAPGQGSFATATVYGEYWNIAAYTNSSPGLSNWISGPGAADFVITGWTGTSTTFPHPAMVELNNVLNISAEL